MENEQERSSGGDGASGCCRQGLFAFFSGMCPAVKILRFPTEACGENGCGTSHGGNGKEAHAGKRKAEMGKAGQGKAVRRAKRAGNTGVPGWL
jgi:hypothetical protein